MSARAAASPTLLDVLKLTATFLDRHGSGSARLDAELLIAHALALRRIDLYLQFDRRLDEACLVQIRELVRRRGRREPIAYITGRREFFSRSFTVTPDVLVPRPETETLVQAVIDRASAAPAGDVVDLGTGSGCVAVTLAAHMSDRRVVAVDASAAALEVAATNAQRHGVSARVLTVHGVWAEALHHPVAIAVSNPPYVTTDELATLPRDVRCFEPRVALDGGLDGLDAYRALLSSLQGKLLPGALLAVEVDPRRSSSVLDLVQAHFPGAELYLVHDLGHAPRVVAGSVSEGASA